MINPNEQDDTLSPVDADEVEAISLFNEITQDSAKDSGSDAVDGLDQERDTNANTSQDEHGAAAGEGQAATDPWSSVPEALRNEYQQLKQQYQQLDANHRANAGRVSALTKKLNDVTAGLKANEQAHGATANSDNGLPTADDLKGKTFAEVEEEFPEIAAFVRHQVEHVQQAFSQQLTPLNELRQQQEFARQQQELQSQYQALAAVHPDFQQISKDQHFHQWVASQPATVQAMAQSDYADDNIALLNLYKGSRPAPVAPAVPARPKTALSDHAEIPRKGPGKAAAEPDDVDPVVYFNQITRI